MKIISFALWGENPKYTIGALKNAQLAKEIYPDWICRYHVGQSVPEIIILNLENHENVEIVRMGASGNWDGMFWRFLPASQADVDVMISRDTDSRLSMREKSAVDDWLNSGKGFHIMRDHPWHGAPIMGGMFGVKKGIIPQMKSLIDGYTKGNYWQVDQEFLRDIVYPLIEKDAAVHDEFFDKIPFPTKRKNLEFIGQVFDENDNTVQQHLDMLKRGLIR